jgi:hypothetical protein
LGEFDMPITSEEDASYAGDPQTVTLIIWPPSRLPTIRYANQQLHSGFPSEGHVALKTYKGGTTGQGEYISFWPGKCKEWNQQQADDLDLCHKDVSHFHTEDDDDLVKRDTTLRPKKIHLHSLNIEAINQLYKEMVEQKINWSPRNNCADIVLALLEAGGLYNRLSTKKYGWKTIFLVGYLSNEIFDKSVESIYRHLLMFFKIGSSLDVSLDQDVNFRWDLWVGGFNGGLKYLFNIQTIDTPFLPSNTLISAAMNAIFSYFLMSSFSSLLSNKALWPKIMKNRIAQHDAIIAASISFLKPFVMPTIFHLLRNPFDQRGNYMIYTGKGTYWSMSISNLRLFWGRLVIFILRDSHISSRFSKNLVTPAIIFSPILIYMINLGIQYFFNTTTLPANILHLANQLKKKEGRLDIKKVSTLSNIRASVNENKKFFSIGLVGVGASFQVCK